VLVPRAPGPLVPDRLFLSPGPVKPSGMVERENAACGAQHVAPAYGVSIVPCWRFRIVPDGMLLSAPVDRSAIESAVLLPGGKVIAMAFQNIRYRPAAGIAAFPDGGIPRYLRDREIIATLPVEGGKPRILQRLENEGVHGSARCYLCERPTRIRIMCW